VYGEQWLAKHICDYCPLSTNHYPLSMYKASELEFQKLLSLALERNASDLHLKVGEPPLIRVDSQLLRMENYQVLSNEMVADLAAVCMSEGHKKLFMEQKDIDLSYTFKNSVRFRINIYTQKGVMSMALRVIPNTIKTIEDLGLPTILRSFINQKQGLMLMVGPTGHGKTTALAAMLDEINHTRSEHILTIEDPIEYVYTPDKSIITQREVFVDTPSFAQALKSALREDVNVVNVGEIRDLESISAALTLAETGHLIFATLHTNDAAQSVDRIVDVFPANQQTQIRAQLANVLNGIVSLRLMPKLGGGRVPAYEILMATYAIKNSIRENKTYEISNIIHTSLEEGMVPMDKTLALLVKQGIVDLETAQAYTTDQEYFLSLIS